MYSHRGSLWISRKSSLYSARAVSVIAPRCHSQESSLSDLWKNDEPDDVAQRDSAHSG